MTTTIPCRNKCWPIFKTREVALNTFFNQACKMQCWPTLFYYRFDFFSLHKLHVTERRDWWTMWCHRRRVSKLAVSRNWHIHHYDCREGQKEAATNFTFLADISGSLGVPLMWNVGSQHPEVAQKCQPTSLYRRPLLCIKVSGLWPRWCAWGDWCWVKTLRSQVNIKNDKPPGLVFST